MITNEYDFVPWQVPASALTVKLYVPVCVVMPLMTPALFSVKPGGNCPINKLTV